jgi:hypothetical protein
MRHTWLAAAVLALFAVGCGERPTVIEYKKGQYQGKPDTQPWAGTQFKGDRVAWESAIKARTNNQNEYSRVVSK